MELPGRAARTLIAVLLPACLGACTVTRQPTPGTPSTPQPAPVPLSLTIAPRTGTRDLPVTAEIGTSVSGGTVTSVTLSDATGRPLPGEPRPDGTSWVPAAPLGYGSTYTATVTATGEDGAQQTLSTRFSTMADPGSGRIATGLYFADGATYGVGMPVVVEFGAPIPDSAKASVERRLFVTSDPPQPGVWHWFGDRQVLYRPQVYWQPGTRLTVRAALGGLPVGRRLLDKDRGGTATIGPKQEFIVRNSTKRMYVYQDGRLTRTFPVSLGKHSTPTSSGNLVIMSHQYVTVFATRLYRITAYYDERITWDGQFLHAAPWSVGSQGRQNVSHGCVNLSMRSAAWVYGMAQIGDPVSITGTEVHVTPGDGWTVWDMNWPEYLKGSALPHPDLEAELIPERVDRIPG
ncbi:MAG TPA: Ig-like domain-containing protein [Rugosimonospora sp.]|nr:Ig-like domain-containing protein [Rugosimonospora sp.]